ncbi:hypothetical protein PMAYCL1PPCAC_26060, partial [Pristionchus mayeri]
MEDSEGVWVPREDTDEDSIHPLRSSNEPTESRSIEDKEKDKAGQVVSNPGGIAYFVSPSKTSTSSERRSDSETASSRAKTDETQESSPRQTSEEDEEFYLFTNKSLVYAYILLAFTIW